MVVKEFLPNPAGKDTEGEWITIQNNGNEAINLKGWKIKDASGKTFAFSEQILGPNQEITLPYRHTKVQINNSGETLLLLNPQNEQVDVASYTGTAKDDVVFVRTGNGAFQQSFSAPQGNAESGKGQEISTQMNPAEGFNTVAEHLTANAPVTLHAPPGVSMDIFLIGLAVAALAAAGTALLAKKHKLLQDEN